MRKMMLRAGPAAVPVLLVLLATRLGRVDAPPPGRVVLPSRYAALVAAARRGARAVDAGTLKKMLAAKDGAPLLIDVREDSEWADGRLPGAVHLGKGVLERDIEKAAPAAGTRIVLYCSGGSRSALAAESLRRMGYTEVFSLDGGLKAWTESGGPLVRR